MADTIWADHDERLIHMDGHDTFNKAVKVLVESTQEACERAGVGLDDIDLFVYHQANGRILKSVGEKLGLEAGARRRLHRRDRQHVRGLDPARARPAARGRAAAARASAWSSPRSAPASPGAPGIVEWGVR